MVPLGVVVVEVVVDGCVVVDVVLVVVLLVVLEVDVVVLLVLVVDDVLELVGGGVVVWPWPRPGGGENARRTWFVVPSTGRAMAAATPRAGTVSAAMTPSTRPYLGAVTVLIRRSLTISLRVGG
jgi:hypothetical protein